MYSGDKWLHLFKDGCIRSKVVVFRKINCMWWQGWFYSGNRWFCIRRIGVCSRAKWLLIGQKLLYSGKSGCIRAKVDVYSEQNLLHSGKSGLYWGKFVAFGPKVVVTRAKVVVFGQNWLYLDKICCIRAKWLCFGQKLFYSGKSVFILVKSGCI